ncbi:hypothetical protein ACLOJK_038342 [Asimina triloba]
MYLLPHLLLLLLGVVALVATPAAAGYVYNPPGNNKPKPYPEHPPYKKPPYKKPPPYYNPPPYNHPH